ncbi:MAG: cupredoxin domain-containing protein [Acidobacteriota bacterium]|nr:cupredoxin domain-containing protein [Acidobacteriota bacterium]
MAAFFALAALTGPVWATTDEPATASTDTVLVQVEAERFRFRPARIRVPAGSRVELELTSRDVEHGFEIPGTDTKVTIPPRGGGSVTVVVHAEKTGKIRFRCARPCGAGHAEMAGVIVVK